MATVINKERMCKICNSPIRLEIEIQHFVRGRSLRDIEEYAVSHDLDVSYQILRRHFMKHVDEKREVQVRYIARKEDGKQSDEVSVKLRELDNLDACIKEATDLMRAAAMEIKRQLKIMIPRQVKIKDDKGKETGKVMEYTKTEVSHSIVTLFKGSAEEIRQSAKTKMEILGIDKKKADTKDAVDTLVEAMMKLEEE